MGNYKLSKSGNQIDAILLHSVVYINGVFNSLESLQTAYPTGDDNLYRVGNKWYFWDGNVWAEGGDFDVDTSFKYSMENITVVDNISAYVSSNEWPTYPNEHLFYCRNTKAFYVKDTTYLSGYKKAGTYYDGTLISDRVILRLNDYLSYSVNNIYNAIGKKIFAVTYDGKDYLVSLNSNTSIVSIRLSDLKVYKGVVNSSTVLNSILNSAQYEVSIVTNDMLADYCTVSQAEALGTSISNHTGNTNNPHSVTKAQVGLGNVDNTSDANKPVSTAQQTALNAKQDKITSTNKLSSDLVDDTNKTHKFATAEQLAQIALNQAGISYLGDYKVDKVSGKGLSTNDFTDTDKGNVDDNTAARHTHSNKALLDTYSQTEANLSDAVNKKHNHANKSILDATTASYTTTEKTKLSGVESGAQANVIETIKVDNVALTPSQKSVNIDLSGKVDKVTSANKVYGTDNSGAQTAYSIDYGVQHTGTVVRRDTNSQVTVPLIPTNSAHATSKDYVDNKIAEIKRDAYTPVDTTTYPTLADFLDSTGQEGYLYLYPIDTSDLTKGYYRYIWETNAWVSLGTTEIDLSSYYTKTETNTLLSDKADKSNTYRKTEVDAALSNKVDKVTGKGLSTNDFTDSYKGQVDSNTTARHSHSNKSLLDTYDQTNANLADAVSKKHSHSNKSTLDNITAAYTTEEQTKLSGIASGAQVNVIETIKVNGTAQTVTSKSVNINVPTKTSDLTNDSNYVTSAGLTTILNDYYTSSEVDTLLGGKVDKVTGKGLSTNDFTTAYKNAVDANTTNRHTHSNKSLLDSYTQTEANLADAVAKKHSHSNKSILDATEESYTTAKDTKLSGIASGAQVNVIETIKVNGTALTPSSKAVDISVPAAQVQSDWNATSGVAAIKNKPSLATVATSGSYSDLNNKPSAVLYTSQTLRSDEKEQARNNIGAGTSNFSGSYNDLSNKPTIPAAQIQSDWTQADTSALDYIKHKPTIPSSAADVGAAPTSHASANSTYGLGTSNNYGHVKLNNGVLTEMTTAADGVAAGQGHTHSQYLLASKCTYQTTAPTAAISDGGVHIVFLQSEPTTKYAGYIYLIAEN